MTPTYLPLPVDMLRNAIAHDELEAGRCDSEASEHAAKAQRIRERAEGMRRMASVYKAAIAKLEASE